MTGTVTIPRKYLYWAAAAIAAIAILALVTGCAKFTEPFKDAPTAGHDGSPPGSSSSPTGSATRPRSATVTGTSS